MTFRNDLNNHSQRLKYNHFFKNNENQDFLKAVLEIVPKILEKHEEIKEFILNISPVDLNRRKLLIKELDLRKEKILIPCLERAKNFLNLKQDVDKNIKEEKILNLLNKFKKQ